MTTVQTNGHGPDNKNNMILNKAKRDFNKDLNRLPHKKGWKGIWLLEAGAQNYTGHIFSPFVTLYYHDTSTEYPLFSRVIMTGDSGRSPKAYKMFSTTFHKIYKGKWAFTPIKIIYLEESSGLMGCQELFLGS